VVSPGGEQGLSCLGVAHGNRSRRYTAVTAGDPVHVRGVPAVELNVMNGNLSHVVADVRHPVARQHLAGQQVPVVPSPAEVDRGIVMTLVARLHGLVEQAVAGVASGGYP